MSSIIVIVVTSLLFSAFFSGMEIAFTGANKLKLEIDSKKNRFFGRLSKRFTDNPGQYITTILVGNNIALVIYTTYMSLLIHAVAARMGFAMQDGAVLLETAISTIVIIFIGEYTPKSVVRLNPNFYLRALILPVYICYVVLYPLAKFTTWLSFGLLRLVGFPVKRDHAIKSFGKIDLEHLIEENADKGEETDNDIKIFQNALDFSDLRIRDCMVPRVDIEAIEINDSVELLSEKFIESKYSRIFVWEGSIDNIIGYVNTKSLFKTPRSVSEILIPVSYVPETMYAERLLSQFIKRKTSIAVVIDEFGGTAGIISIEDILEEIFGEIEDEHDSQDLIEKEVGKNEWVLSCRLEVDYLNEKYGLGIEESDEYDTLAGYIISHESGIPAVGNIIDIDNKRIKILKTSSSRLDLARVKIL